MLDVCYCSAICTNWDNKANAIATHRVAKACMNSLFKIFIPLLYYFTRYSYYFTRYCLRTAGLMWKSEKANSSKIWPRCTAAHNSDRIVLSPWHYKVLKTSMHKGPIWECNLKFRFKLICFGTIHTLRQEKDWVSSKNGSFCFNVHYCFAYVHYCIYADIVRGSAKGPKMCWRNIWMVPLLLNDEAFRESILHFASKLELYKDHLTPVVE